MTALALVLAPVATAVVLLVSGWSKVGDVTGLRLAFVAMRVPAALSRPAVVRSLPYVELTLGLALLLTWGWLLAVVGAMVTVLFLAYTLLVARVLRAGDTVDCQCFGSLGDDRVTPVDPCPQPRAGGAGRARDGVRPRRLGRGPGVG